jgi:large subunit ribosomal protein L1
MAKQIKKDPEETPELVEKQTTKKAAKTTVKTTTKAKKADVKAKTKNEKNPEVKKNAEPKEDTESKAEESAEEKKAVAKAGKRSAKALAEAEEKAEKEARKAEKAQAESDEEDKPKKPAHTPARPKSERRSKKYKTAYELIKKDTQYKLQEASELAAKTSTTKFDSSVEMHIRLGVDPRHADQNIRETVTLPAGTGKTIRIAVFAEEDVAKKALATGADIAGIEQVTDLLDKGQTPFDVLIAVPESMAKLGKYARILGPKKLMPNPKSGTVTKDVEKAITEAKAGRIELRVDTNGIVHANIGKVSFGQEGIYSNAKVVLQTIKNAKPSSTKGTYVRSVYLTTSMGPSIQIDTTEV